ncbi:hypothetical protein AVEN_71340-1 [Araneus ventricosus]|uniref:Uncharacterized protein n=1 Tax=Araneus ventricosus TaxID=182803 RepID=A0A4Y2BHH4_ARAVE|nr:hypothetical protein AVEN_71340-1 [Araneus ventricosus]
MYSRGHPAWALLHPIFIRQSRDCEPRGPGKACLSSQLGKIVRETFLPRRARKIRYHCVPGIMKDQGSAVIHHSVLNRDPLLVCYVYGANNENFSRNVG